MTSRPTARMNSSILSLSTSVLTALIALLLIAARPAQAQTETVLYDFCSQANCTDGNVSASGLTPDAAGNLYGTTNAGGASTEAGFGNGGGAVYELSPNGSGGWNETVLYSFCSAPNCTDGFFPTRSPVIFDSAGNLYGTTSLGGASINSNCYAGCGVVFELSPSATGWKETVLYNFCSQADCTDGNLPFAGVIMDSAGNLYGTTTLSGDPTTNGVVFKLSPSVGGWTEQVIYDAGMGWPGLTMDTAGNIFANTVLGTVVEISPNGSGGWTSTVLHTFGVAPDGAAPTGTLVLDKSGNVYGTTQAGGANNYGTVYELSPGTSGWTESILYSFKSNNDGRYPVAGVVFDPDGDIYGTTSEGSGGTLGLGQGGNGTVYELVAPVGNGSYYEKVLWSFDVTDGNYPFDSLLLDSAGNFYGTTEIGGLPGGPPGYSGFGVAFELSHVTALTLTSSPNPANTGQTVAFTATATSSGGTPPNGETVTFYNGSAVLGTAPLSGGTASKGSAATLTTSFLQGGTFTITASYAGDSNFAPATSPALQQTVINTAKSATSTALVSSLNPSVYGQSITFTATVTSTGGTPPNGETVTFYNGLNILGTATLTGGIASLTKSSLGSGIHSISAAYLGDANFTASTSLVLEQGVDTTAQSPTTTAIASSLNPSIYGQTVTWTATVTTSGKTTPTGRVNFNWSDYSIGSATLNSSGVATLTKSTLSADPYPLFAVYVGDANNGPSASPILNQTVTQTTSAATLTSSPNPSAQGQSVTFTAIITSPTTTPTGPVTFTAGKTTLGTVELSKGKATFTTSTLAVGSTTVTVTYPWNSDINTSSASVVQTVTAGTGISTTTTLTSSLNPASFGNQVTFTAQVTSSLGTPPNGEIVTFYNGSSVIGPGVLNGGAATMTTSLLPGGSSSITASYPGDSTFLGSTSAPLHQVIQTTTTAETVNWAADPPLNETFTATVTGPNGIPTGSVTFTVGNTVLGTSDLNANGVATLTVATLAVGSNTVTAAYSGDQNNPSTSAWTTQTFVMPYNATMYLQQEKGSAGAVTEFGAGTWPTNFVEYYSGLPNNPNPTGQVLVGSFDAGTIVNVGMYTVYSDLNGWSFSNEVSSNQPSLISFADLNNTLGLNHSITQQTSPTTWVLWLDDAMSYLVDDDNNDVIMEIILVPN
jgi:uncharacterized repeat protein (TIGR03803 family)